MIAKKSKPGPKKTAKSSKPTRTSPKAPTRKRVQQAVKPPVKSPASTAGRRTVSRKPAVVRPVSKVKLLQLDKSEMQEISRRLRAERDSALAEGERLAQRLREMEAEQARRIATEPQKAGPGGFDPSVDLDEDSPTQPDEDLEVAAGFFDRIDEVRARRIELDRERNDRELEQSDQPFWMICPKCGDLMEEQESESIKLERCDTCGGLYLDRGEVDLLISLSNDADGFRRLHNALKF